MADLELTLRDLARTGASAIAIAGLTVLVLALGAELLRRRHAESALLRVADRFVPTPIQRVAAGILTLLATATSFAMPSVASADTSLRGWLESPSVPTTVVTPATSSPSVQPSVKPSKQATDSPPGRPAPASSTRDPSQPSAPVRTTPDAQGSAATAPTSEVPQSPAPGPVVHRRSPAGAPATSPRASRTPSATAVPSAPAAPPTQASSVPTADVSPAPADDSARYVVVAGNCLWDIAARLIGPGASNAAIDRRWRAIYAANRAAIGDDPGLIQPGLVLTIPTLDTTP